MVYISSKSVYTHLQITGKKRMPQSFVLNLMTRSTIPVRDLQGFSLQKLFFNLVDTVDPELGKVLKHDKQNRSYSLSAIQLAHTATEAVSLVDNHDTLYEFASPDIADSRSVRVFTPKKTTKADVPLDQLQFHHCQAVSVDQRCWWRISFLDDDLFDHLIFLWNQLQAETFSLGAGLVTIQSIDADAPGVHLSSSAWASGCSYRDIYEQASVRDRNIHLQFITPTAFEKEGQLTPLPTAEAVFHPLRKYWNHYSGLAFAPSLVSKIVPTHFNIQTENIHSDCHNKAESILGCTGQMSFRIVGDDDPLIIKRINTLANFTRYCGVGCNTRLGMGVIRRINSPEMRHAQPPISTPPNSLKLIEKPWFGS